MFKALFGQKNSKRHAHALYGVVVAKSRDAEFFQSYGVPDTFDGRFEMLVVHLFILHSRLKDEDLPARKISQLVFDYFIDDMDSSLREAGVGDQTVPKRIAKMTQVFYGRTGAFESALRNENSREAMAEVIERNLFPDGDGEGRQFRLADYMLGRIREIEAMGVDEIIDQHEIFGAKSK